jgi:hypothetical protein
VGVWATAKLHGNCATSPTTNATTPRPSASCATSCGCALPMPRCRSTTITHWWRSTRT